MDDRFKDVFLEETADLLGSLEQSLMELDAEMTNLEIIDEVFRVIHTIKGTSAMFGFDYLSAFVHEAENLLDKVREGAVAVNKDFISLIFTVKDVITLLLSKEEYSAGEKEQVEIIKQSLIEFQAQSPGSVELKMEDEKDIDSLCTYRIQFRPHEDLLLSGTKPLFLLMELKQLGDLVSMAHTEKIPTLEDFDIEKCYVFWDLFLRTSASISSIKDVFIFVEDKADIDISLIDRSDDFYASGEYKKLGQILVDRHLVEEDDLSRELGSKKRIGEMLVDKGVISHGDVKAALFEQKFVRELRQERSQFQNISSIKVKSEKLDSLIDLVGELVTLQARLSQTALERGDQDLDRLTEDFERITDELRSNTMNIRMVPIGFIFNKYRRLIRDLSVDLSKEIDLVMEGADTELDKSVIEKLNDPLIHLIRNSIDHGLETPAEREAAGKTKTGILTLSARQTGADIVIKVSDDGKGLSREKIIAKAVKNGLISSGDRMSDEEVYNLIFEPGFSTAQSISNISGRGVGLDVVKRSIETLSGKIEIQTESGKGTCFILKIPLTLAIVEGLLIELGNEKFVIPLMSVDRCIEVETDDTKRQDIRALDGDMLPYIDLRRFFQIDSEVPEIQNIVVVKNMGKKVGLVIDKVIGEYQTVIKSLGILYRDTPGISGATILGDGTIALILDIFNIIGQTEVAEHRSVLK